MSTKYQNLITGTITADPGSGGTSVSASVFQTSLDAVTAPDTMWAVLDPLGVNGAPEIVQITAHTAAAVSCTVVRAQQGTTARAHPIGTTVVVSPVTESDLDELPFRKMTTRGDILIASAANTAARLAVGTNGQVLTSNGTDPSWGQVPTAGIADSAVTSAKIANDTIVNADVSTSAAIAVSKLEAGTGGNVLIAGPIAGQPTWTALSGDVTVSNIGVTTIGAGVIVNADVSASAALAVSKLEAGTNGQVLRHIAGANGWGPGFTTGGTVDLPAGADGMMFWDTTLNTLFAHDGTGWIYMAEPAQAWIPSWTNVTVGNGTVDAWYRRSDGWCDCYLQFVLGSTSSITGAITISPPTNMHSAFSIVGEGHTWIRDTSAATNYPALLIGASTSAVTVYTYNAAAAGSATTTATAGGSPMTWATGDTLYVGFRYRMASRYD